MIDAICSGIFVFILYSLFGLVIGMILDTAYDIDMLLGCVFAWPIIGICIGVLESIKIVRILIVNIKKR